MVEHCNEHIPLTDKVGQVQVDMSAMKVSVTNMDRALIQVMDELSKRKLTPMTVWIISLMSGSIGGMGIWILNHIVN